MNPSTSESLKTLLGDSSWKQIELTDTSQTYSETDERTRNTLIQWERIYRFNTFKPAD